jgi:hypothetical protein
MNKGTAGSGRPKLGGTNEEPPKISTPRLAEAGISKRPILERQAKESSHKVTFLRFDLANGIFSPVRLPSRRFIGIIFDISIMLKSQLT